MLYVDLLCFSEGFVTIKLNFFWFLGTDWYLCMSDIEDGFLAWSCRTFTICAHSGSKLYSDQFFSLNIQIYNTEQQHKNLHDVVICAVLILMCIKCGSIEISR
jgi:hypothetical protein